MGIGWKSIFSYFLMSLSNSMRAAYELRLGMSDEYVRTFWSPTCSTFLPFTFCG